MPGKRGDEPRKGLEEAPRTDLPPTKEPYDDGWFGTGEEEGVEREREAPVEREREASEESGDR